MHVAAIAGKTERETTEHATWFSWMLGGALLIAVIAAALHFSEQRAFVRVAEEARPWWLGLAVLLQFENLLLRIQDAFLADPALALTLPAAEARFGADGVAATGVLEALVDAGVLSVREGTYRRRFPTGTTVMLPLDVGHDIGWHRPAFDGAHLQACARRVLVQIHQVSCGIRGHDLVLTHEPHHLSLQCMNCGWKSPGWWISPRRARCREPQTHCGSR